MLRSLALLLCGLSFAAHAEDSMGRPSQNLRVTAFNIEWYGLGGSLEGDPSKEKRDSTLKDFLSSYVPKSDIMVFEEVVDIDRLVKKVLPPQTKCISYVHADAKHQHVVVCISKNYKFLKEQNDDNDVIDDVAINDRSRPAVHAIVADLSGKPVLRVIGVHLKAMPNESKARLFQMEKIGEFIRKTHDPKLPVLITGDFNTYDVVDTKLDENDDILFDRVFTRLGMNISQAATSLKYTYWSPRYQSHFDRFWVSGNVPVQGEVGVTGMCNKGGNSPYQDPHYYSKAISDHCPVTLTLKLK